MKKLILACVLAASASAWAITEQDVNFAQRKCAMRNDYQECANARNLARIYQQQERDRLEHDAAVRAGKPMAGSSNSTIYIENEGDGRGAYRWNAQRRKYCYYNSNGSIHRCAN